MIRYLVSDCDISVDVRTNDGRTPLYVAASFGRESSVGVLHELGADCAAMNDKESLRCTLQRSGTAETIRLLVSLGVNASWKKPTFGFTALHSAADAGYDDVVRYLVSECGVFVDARTTNGRTPLFVAASCGHDETVRVLFELGADPTAEKRGVWSAR